MKPDLMQVDAEADEFDLNAILGTLWKGKLWILGGTFLALVAASDYLLRTPPTFQADALLQLQSNKSNLALPSAVSELLGNNEPSTLAEMEIIRSRQILGRAVAEMNLAWVAEPIQNRDMLSAIDSLFDPVEPPSIKLAYLEVPAGWLDVQSTLKRTGELDFEIALPDGLVLNGKVGQTASNTTVGFALNISSLTGDIGQSYRIIHRSDLAAIRNLAGALSVTERGRQTGILEIRLTDGDRIAARDKLNAVIQAYSEQNISNSAAEAQKSLDFVMSQLPLAQAALDTAESALNDYRAGQNSVDLEFETKSLLTETTTIEAKLRELTLQEEELKQKYTLNHPLYRQLLEERKTLMERLRELQFGISNLPATQREIINLTRNLELAQSVYFELINRSQELRVLAASQVGSVRIIDDAQTQVAPIGPNKKRTLLLATLLGLAGAAGLVLVRNWLRRGIDSVQEVERLGIPVFATISLYRSRSRGKLPVGKVIARDEPDDVFVETFRSLRTSLHFAMLDARTKSILLTSSEPGAGKSFIAANLAVVAAQAGQRVCLIDADMRRGTQQKSFGRRKNQKGLSDYLAETSSLDDVLCETNVKNLSLIFAGAFPPNPSELLMRKTLLHLIDELDERFDLVICDAPPTLAVTDAVVIGRHVGTVIAVARHNATSLADLEEVQRAFSLAGVSLKAAILNAYDPRKANAGTSRYGYRYGYANRYAYKRDDSTDGS